MTSFAKQSPERGPIQQRMTAKRGGDGLTLHRFVEQISRGSLARERAGAMRDTQFPSQAGARARRQEGVPGPRPDAAEGNPGAELAGLGQAAATCQVPR